MLVRATIGLISFLGCAAATVDTPARVEPVESVEARAERESEPEELAARSRAKKKPRHKKRRRIHRKRPSQPVAPPRDEAPPSTTPASLGAEVQAQLLDAHNASRVQVGVQPLAWSDEVAQTAQGWAGELAANGCGLQHNPKKPYGENLYMTTAPKSGAEVTASWTSEATHYNAENNSCAQGEICGHYTQVVWGGSQKLGCGMATCGSTQVWVCNYDPPGNYVGQKPF